MFEVKKAVIPVAGFGTRFMPYTKAVPKAMLPILNIPAIQIITEDFVALQQAQVGFAVKIAGETIELVPSATSGDYSIAYFAKTDISAEYFNTDITAEIVIAYESGSATIASANANLYELASDLVLQNEIAIMDGQALFNQAAAKLIEKYLNVANA